MSVLARIRGSLRRRRGSRLAVIPFPDRSWLFGAGALDGITTRLGSLDGLSVVGLSSSLAFSHRTTDLESALDELGVEFESRKIITRTDTMDAPEFAALSDRRKVPLLEHGDLMIGESAAISLYLADTFREHREFVPEPATAARARHDELCWFAMVEMDAILYRSGDTRACPTCTGLRRLP